MARAGHQDPDYYALLGVGRGSSLQEIRAAYRKLSMKTHPDRGGSNEAQARINHAYEILSDPKRRRRYDRELTLRDEAVRGSGGGVRQGKPARREAWEKSLYRKKGAPGFTDRVRKEFTAKSEEIKAGRGARAEALFRESSVSFRTMRRRCVASAAAACAFGAAGCMHPALWAGTAVSLWAAVRFARYGRGGNALFVLNPEWEYLLRRQSRAQADLEAVAGHARLEKLAEAADRLIAQARKRTGGADGEGTVLGRITAHFFLLGFVPVSHDADERVVLLDNGRETMAVRYRHRRGSPVNAAFIKRFCNYMKDNAVQRGFVYAGPGLSANAAGLADSFGILHYSSRDLNAWLCSMTSRRYAGPRGDIIGMIGSFVVFKEENRIP